MAAQRVSRVLFGRRTFGGMADFTLVFVMTNVGRTLGGGDGYSDARRLTKMCRTQRCSGRVFW